MTTPSPKVVNTMEPSVEPPGFNYPLLPPEVHNKIMSFVLCPANGIHPLLTRSGIRLLAISHENYNDGHMNYYADSIFHIPHGTQYAPLLHKYQQKHCELIRYITLICSILDLDRAEIEAVMKDEIRRSQAGTLAWMMGDRSSMLFRTEPLRCIV